VLSQLSYIPIRARRKYSRWVGGDPSAASAVILIFPN
jgi:hypothetical protein